MITIGPNIPALYRQPKQQNAISIGKYNGQKKAANAFIERRKLADRRQNRQSSLRFDRRQISDRRRPAIDFSV